MNSSLFARAIAVVAALYSLSHYVRTSDLGWANLAVGFLILADLEKGSKP